MVQFAIAPPVRPVERYDDFLQARDFGFDGFASIYAGNLTTKEPRHEANFVIWLCDSNSSQLRFFNFLRWRGERGAIRSFGIFENFPSKFRMTTRSALWLNTYSGLMGTLPPPPERQ